MKRTLFLLAMLVSATLQGQNLSTAYKNGDVNLVPDSNYGAANNWDKLFPDYNEKFFDKPTGISKNIVVAPDGSVFMSHESRYSISKFDKNGNFVKEFGKKGGKNPADFIYTPHVEGILDGKYLYTTAVDGRMHFFDLDGKWVKTIALKYMPLKTVPLKNGNIAILGHVPWKNGVKNIISILNFNTEKEKIINSEISAAPFVKNATGSFTPYTYTDENGKEQRIVFLNLSPQFLDGFIYRERFAVTADGNLVIAYPKTGIVKILDTNGNILKQFNADIEREVITREDREEYYQNALKTLKELEAKVVKTQQDKKNWDKYIEQFKPYMERLREPDRYPDMPYFSELLVDSENNILLFRFTKETGSNRFDAYTYDSWGKKIATSRFIAGGYDLRINPAILQFHNGSIYSFLKKNDIQTGNPMRLVKFNIKTGK